MLRGVDRGESRPPLRMPGDLSGPETHSAYRARDNAAGTACVYYKRQEPSDAYRKFVIVSSSESTESSTFQEI